MKRLSPLLIIATIVFASATSHKRLRAELEADGSLDMFLSWAREESILDMYRDVILGRVSADTARVDDHPYRPLSVPRSFTVLAYHYPDMNATFAQELLANSSIYPQLPIETINTQLRYQEILSSLPARVLQVIYAHRHEGIETIWGAILSTVPEASRITGSLALKDSIQIWLNFCVSELVSNTVNLKSCVYDVDRRQWRMIGNAKSALFRFFALRYISHQL